MKMLFVNTVYGVDGCCGNKSLNQALYLNGLVF